MSLKYSMNRKMSARDRTRWFGILTGAACLITGALHPVPLVIFEKQITDNAFLALGAAVMLLTFGAVQLVKAWKGGGPAQ